MLPRLTQCLRSTAPLLTRAYTTTISKPRVLNRVVGVGIGLLASGVGYCAYCNMGTPATAHAKEAGSGSRLVLYQYANCPFCSKVRAYLHYSGEEFDVVEVNPITKEQHKALGTSYRKVPLVMADGVELVESSVIVSLLDSHFNTGTPISELVKVYPKVNIEKDPNGKDPDVPVQPSRQGPDGWSGWFVNLQRKWWRPKEIWEYPNRYQVMGWDPDTAEHQQKEVHWRVWVDKHFVHLISPNVYRTRRESLAAFDYFTQNGNFTTWQKTYTKYIGAGVMYLIGRRLTKRHGLDATNVRLDLYAGANKWLHGVGNNKFMGGDQPDLADISMFGMCSAFEGMECWQDLVQHTKIEPWYNRVKAVLQERSKSELTVVNPCVDPSTAVNE